MLKIQFNLQKFFVNQKHLMVTNHKRLCDLLSSNAYNVEVSKIINRRGYQPTLTLEEGILDRISSAGFSHLVEKDLDKLITTNALRQAVLKSKKVVTKPTLTNINYMELYNATARVIKACRFPRKKFTPLEGMFAFENCVNKSASSGYPLFKPKGQIRHAVLAEYRLYQRLDPMEHLFKYPSTASFRAQLRGSEKIDVKLRVMYPITAVITLMETIFVKPFVDHFTNIDTFYSIGRTGGQIGAILKSNFKGKKKIVSLDVESFDQYMPNDVLICAFYILRRQLSLTAISERQFNFVVQYFMQSIVAYKVGKQRPQLYIKEHGIPSGSGFTNLIGTLSHAIIIEYLSPGLLSRNAQICSDDNIFSYNDNEEYLFESYKSVFGLTVSKTKTTVTNDPTNIKYLGFKWIHFSRHIDVKLALNQCLWHSDYRTDLDKFDREVARCSSTLLNGKNGALIFANLFPDVLSALRKGLDIKFLYLRTGRPPSKLLDLTADHANPSNGETKNSLTQHLRYGYLIR
jgi:hypothetical protein